MEDTARARARALPPHHGLPDEITIWEILVRLPPKSLLRCRAVCPAWRRATSTRDFLLAHHARQPSLPLLYGFNDVDGVSLDVIPFDLRRAGLAAADRLQYVARLGDAFFGSSASCDGLLVLPMSNDRLVLCNPATRQYARLPMLSGFAPLGMYPHSPTGEYRLLLFLYQNWRYENDAPDDYYVFALGSSEPPRHIGLPDADEHTYATGSVLFNGSLHWHPGKMIIVFDTTAESFRQMHAPLVPGRANLFEMDGMLGLSSFNDAATTIDIWMARDYEHELWAIKYRVQLLVAEFSVQFGKFYKDCSLVVASCNDVLVLVKFGEWLLQADGDGKLVTSFHRRGLGPTQYRLKQTLVQHTFFPTLEGDLVSASPFIWPEDYVVNT